VPTPPRGPPTTRRLRLPRRRPGLRPDPPGEPADILPGPMPPSSDSRDLSTRHLSDLHHLAAELGIERYRVLGRDGLVAAILERDPDAAARPMPAAPAPTAGAGAPAAADDEEVDGSDDPGEPVVGVLDITPRGHGFIRLSGLDSDEDDVYVSPSQIRRCEMQRGDEVAGPARKPRRGERYPALIHVDTINGVEPGTERIRLEDATPIFPSRRIDLSPVAGTSAEAALLLRSVDLLVPLARGQRVLVDAAPGSGRSALLRALAEALSRASDIELVVLLIDERPEEVAGWRDAAPDADLAVATAEMRSGEQLRLVELAFGRASRKAESGADVVLLVDSISRIAVAADDPGRVKPIFGAGRETAEEGVGSLTVVATTLGDAGEDEGRVERALETTENALIVLDPELAGAGVYPSIDFTASRITGEEHVREGAELDRVRSLRVRLGGMSPAEASAEVRRLLEASPDNATLISSLPG